MMGELGVQDFDPQPLNNGDQWGHRPQCLFVLVIATLLTWLWFSERQEIPALPFIVRDDISLLFRIPIVDEIYSMGCKFIHNSSQIAIQSMEIVNTHL